MYVPLAPAGFARDSAATSARGVGQERLVGEARLAYAGVDDAGLFDAELDRTALGVLHGLTDIGRDRADPRVGHQATRSEDLTEPADQGHHVRAGDDPVEFHEPALDPLDEILGADDFGAGRARFVGLGVLGDDRDANVTDRCPKAVTPRRGPAGRRDGDRLRD